MNKSRQAQIIAAAATLLIAFGLLVVLWYTSIGYSREELAAASIPEEPDMEEVYIEPEMLVPQPTNEAEESADEVQEAAPEALGLPEKVEEPPKEHPVQVTHSENPNPSRSNENLTTQRKPSPVTTQPAANNPKPDSRITSQMGAQFNAHNGSTSGRQGGIGTGGTGISVSSQGIIGRTFKGYKGSVKSDKTFHAAVKVRVTVGENGNIKEASLISAGGAPQAIAKQCVDWARKCSWSAKPGAADAQGVITYNIEVKP